MRVVKILGGILVVLLLLVAITFVAARFSDGPIALFPGGPLVSGELVTTPISSWEFAAPIGEIELQLARDDTSRTTWILVYEGKAYVPASLEFPPGKTWHLRADEDGAAILRIDGKRYPVTLTRIHDAALENRLGEVALAKYDNVPPGDGGAWFFEVASRAP